LSLSNQDIVTKARELAARSDGLKRRASLCVSVAAGTTGSVTAARRVLGMVELRDVQRAALALLDELAEVNADDGVTHG
jgi:hypothetical protein